MLRDGCGKTFRRVIIRTGKTDLRLGIDRIKGLAYEGDGYVLPTKRLTSGSFQWPRNADDEIFHEESVPISIKGAERNQRESA